MGPVVMDVRLRRRAVSPRGRGRDREDPPGSRRARARRRPRGQGRICDVLAAVAALAFVCGPLAPGRGARAEDAPKGSAPLPLTGRQTVHGGKVYVVDGAQVIPGGSVIRVEANVNIIGINKASLEVKGGFL